MNRLFPPGVFAAALHKKNGGRCYHLKLGLLFEAAFDISGTDTRSRYGYDPAEGEPVLGHAEGGAVARVLLKIVAQTGRFRELFGLDAAPSGTEASIDEAWDLQHALKGGLNDPVVRAVFPGGWEQKPEPPVLTTHLETAAEIAKRKKYRAISRFAPWGQRQTSPQQGEVGAVFTPEMELAWYILGRDYILSHPDEVAGSINAADYVDFVNWKIERMLGTRTASTPAAAKLSTVELLRRAADELEAKP